MKRNEKETIGNKSKGNKKWKFTQTVANFSFVSTKKSITVRYRKRQKCSVTIRPAAKKSSQDCLLDPCFYQKIYNSTVPKATTWSVTIRPAAKRVARIVYWILGPASRLDPKQNNPSISVRFFLYFPPLFPLVIPRSNELQNPPEERAAYMHACMACLCSFFHKTLQQQMPSSSSKGLLAFSRHLLLWNDSTQFEILLSSSQFALLHLPTTTTTTMGHYTNQQYMGKIKGEGCSCSVSAANKISWFSLVLYSLSVTFPKKKQSIDSISIWTLMA